MLDLIYMKIFVTRKVPGDLEPLKNSNEVSIYNL